jgi:hypothetical protein
MANTVFNVDVLTPVLQILFRGNVVNNWVLRNPKKPALGRPRSRWVDNINVGLQEVGWVAWTGLIWLRIGTGSGLL